MKTKLFLLMAIVLFACSTAKAYDAEIDGIYYNFNENEATVTYNDDYDYYSGDIVIPKSVIYNEKTYSVTSIGERAFYECYDLTSVNIPNSVTYIGYEAFYYCEGLTSVTIPNSVKIINYDAFNGCSGLTSVTIPNSVTSIKSNAFSGCDGLTSVTIPNSVTSIGSDAFLDCYFTKESFINNSTLTSNTYWGATICDIETNDGLLITNNEVVKCRPCATSVIIPNSVTSIGKNAFYGCRALTSVTIPNSVTSIGSDAFRLCSRLRKVIVPDIAAWCGIAFGNEYANPLRFAKHLYSDEATEITNLIIPNSVTSIGDYAFHECNGLTSVTIPNSVTSIGSQAFAECSGLTSVTINSNAVASKSYDNSHNIASIFGSKVKEYIFGEGVQQIGKDAFYDCSGLTSVTIPNSVTSIGERAFYECDGLTSVTIPNSVTSIGSDAFYGCDGLSSVTIPNSVTSIGDQAFYYCSGLTSVTINSNAVASKSYDSGHTIASIFGSKVKEYIFGEDVQQIGNYAFFRCSSLTSVTIPNSVTSIGSGAFSECSGLTSVTIGNSVKSIENYAFASCSKLTDVYCYAESVPSTGSDAFTGSNIQKATLHVPGSKAAYEAVSPWNGFGEIVEMTSPITIGETGFATFCSSYALDFSDVTDIKAYIVSGFNQETGTLVLTRVTEVPAGEGLYIAGTPGERRIPKTQTSMFYANLLKGVTEPTIISPTDGNYTNYILSNGSYGVGFYTLSQTGTLDAGKAYLQLPTASVAGIKALKIEFDENDDPTGIAITSTSSAEENTIYNLAGQRVSKAHRGINIVNGKKVFIK